MKKTIAIVLLLAMALCLCACGENNKEPRFLGTWSWENAETGDTATMILNADGTASFELTGQNAGTYDFTWTAESVSSVIVKWAGTPVPAAKGEEDTTAEDTTEAVELPAAPDSTKKDDPSVVGYGSLRVINGEMWLMFAEGSSADILLFTYGLKKIA